MGAHTHFTDRERETEVPVLMFRGDFGDPQRECDFVSYYGAINFFERSIVLIVCVDDMGRRVLVQ